MGFDKVLITGSCGLVGSEAVRYFANLGAKVLGIDNNARRYWFGSGGDTTCVKSHLEKIPRYKHIDVSVVQYARIEKIVRQFQPDLVIHCAAQPSHDKSAEIPLQDFHVNATGTINVLEAIRVECPDTPFVFCSTNKVYGDRPNLIPVIETDTRFEYADPKYQVGINEEMSIDNCTHSPFGASKASADLIVQEYGRYFGMRTVCFRCGCITGSNHQGVEKHGFLNYLCRTARQKQPYTLYGYQGKQVRDNIHAYDLVRAFDHWTKGPMYCGEAYNIGGGKDNSCSILEAISLIEELSGWKIPTKDGDARVGDHRCYYTDFSKFQRHHPDWKLTRDLKCILTEMLFGEQ